MARITSASRTINDNYGNSWSCTPEWYDEHVREEKSYVAEKEKETFVSGHFLRYDGTDIYGLKSGENYWLEYVGNDTYIGRSDNILNQRFDITPKQLFTLFSVITDYKESAVEDVNSKTESEDEANAPVGYGKYVDEKLFEATKRYYADNLDPNRYSLADVFYEGVRTGQHLSVLDAEAHKKDVLNQTAMSIIDWVDINTLEENESLSGMECEGITNFVLDSDWGRLYGIVKDKLEHHASKIMVKPAASETAEDKDKPNVKEGDWLINSEEGQPIKITKIYKDAYGADRCALTFTDGTRTDPFLKLVIADENTRHWDVRKDAKDGDILVWDDFGDNSYCSLNVYLGKIENGYAGNYSYYYYNLSEIKPADKEERTMLETALRNAGIKWNADDKTIVVVEPKFNVGDTIIKSRNSDINDFGQFTITDITGGKYYYNDRIICDIVDQDEWEKINNAIGED